MNKPLVKSDWLEEGQKWSDAEVAPFPDRHQHPIRSQRRTRPGRRFNNKKGPQVVVTYLGRGRFSRVHKDLSHLKGKTVVHYKLVRI